MQRRSYLQYQLEDLDPFSGSLAVWKMTKHSSVSGGMVALSLSLLLCSQAFASRPLQSDSVKFVIHISIDGLRPDAVTVLGPDRAPTFHRLRSEGAFTDNARTDIDLSNTLPNHADMLTGRRVYGSEGHGVSFNDYHPGTFESVNGSYIAGVFDVAHDNGLRTGFFYSKDKFDFYARSWDAGHGQEDTVGVDNGRAKIDHVVFKENGERLTDDWLDEMGADPFQYSFVHYREPDIIGHARGWMSNGYLDAVASIDGYLGQILDLVENDSTLAGKTAIVVTADHGGSGTDHQTQGEPRHFTVPLYVWGPGVEPGADLYQLNWGTRQAYCMIDPGGAALVAPIRNGDSGNLSLALLNLPAIPGSTINNNQDLVAHLDDGVTFPTIQFQSPMWNEAFQAGEPISFEVNTTGGIDEVASVVYELGCDTVGTALEPPFSYESSVAPPGSHVARATVFDADGRFSFDTVSVFIEASVSINGSDTDWLALGIEPLVDTDKLQTDPELALDRLFFRQDDLNFSFGFDAAAKSKQVTYGLYLDLDAARGEQESDPLGYAVQASRQHAPEMIFYFVQDGWTDDAPSFFQLNPESGGWNQVDWPSDFEFAADTATGFLEFAFPTTVVSDYSGEQGFYAQLFTVGETAGAGASESVPSEEGIAFTDENTSTETTVLSAFHNFNFPPFPGEKIRVDGVRFDWTRASIPAVVGDTTQSDPLLALDKFYVTHDLENYYFGIIVSPGSTQVTFGLIIDSGSHDHLDVGPGGPGNANGSAVEAQGFLPDAQIYFDNDTTGGWPDDTPRYYVWNENSGSWGTVAGKGASLPEGSEFGVRAFGNTSFLEFSIPRVAPGIYDSELLAVEVFSVGSTPGAGASASIPSDPNIRFATENTSTEVTFLSAPHTYSVRPLVVATDGVAELPAVLRLLQNYPNPVSTTTTVSFDVDHTQRIRLAVYDLLGRLQVVLFDELTNPGTHRVVLDATSLVSGTYILRLEGEAFGSSRKMVVVR